MSNFIQTEMMYETRYFTENSTLLVNMNGNTKTIDITDQYKEGKNHILFKSICVEMILDFRICYAAIFCAENFYNFH